MQRPVKSLTYEDMLAPAPALPRSNREQLQGDPLDESLRFILHPVSKSDTLMGLAMKYKTTAATIQALNDLPTSNLGFLTTVKVPRPADGAVRVPIGTAESEAAQLRRFRVENHTTETEARFYLEEAGWCFESALQQFKEDSAIPAAVALGRHMAPTATPNEMTDASEVSMLLTDPVPNSTQIARLRHRRPR